MTITPPKSKISLIECCQIKEISLIIFFYYLCSKNICLFKKTAFVLGDKGSQII